MDQKFISVVFPVNKLIFTKRDVADGQIEEITKIFGSLEAFDCAVRFRVKLFGDSSRYAVQFSHRKVCFGRAR